MHARSSGSASVPMNILLDIQKTVSTAGDSPRMMSAPGTPSFDQFLAHCPDSVKDYFEAHPELKTRVEELTRETMVVDASTTKPGLMKAGGLKCWFCTTGAWAGIVIALAGVIAVTQGAAIAPLIALDAGLIPVFAAIFGISDAAMATIAGAAGVTLGGLVTAGCQSAGCC